MSSPTNSRDGVNSDPQNASLISKKLAALKGNNNDSEEDEDNLSIQEEERENADEEISDEDLADPNMNDPDAWISRPFLTENEAHRPAEKAKWAIAEGMDTSKAVVGKPEPHKFFILRQDKENLEHFDIRQFPHIRTFDWNESSHIAALNKTRRQIFERTDPKPHKSRPQWSLKEKSVLEGLIKHDLLFGKTKSTLDWEDIARRFQIAFVGITQNVGELLVESAKKVSGKGWVPAKKTNPKMRTARVGPIGRTAKSLKSQAFKFQSITELLAQYAAAPKSGMAAIKQEEDIPGSRSKPILLDAPPLEEIKESNKRKHDNDGFTALSGWGKVDEALAGIPHKKRKMSEGSEVAPPAAEIRGKDKKDDKTTLIANSSPIARRSKEDVPAIISSGQGQATSLEASKVTARAASEPAPQKGKLSATSKAGDRPAL